MMRRLMGLFAVMALTAGCGGPGITTDPLSRIPLGTLGGEPAELTNRMGSRCS